MRFECDVNYGITETLVKILSYEDLFECDVNYGEMKTLKWKKKIEIRKAKREDTKLIFSFIKKLAKIALINNCKRFEWCCLNWNSPSIAFYKSLSAKPMDEWTTYRLSGDALNKLAE